MSFTKAGIVQLTPLSYASTTLSNSTAWALNSTMQASANVIHLCVETNNVRYRADGTAPTLTEGVVLQKDYDYWWWGFTRSAAVKFQRTTGSAKVSVMAYSYLGQP